MNTFLHSPGLLFIVVLCNIPVLVLVLRLLFDSWSDLGEALVFFLGPWWFRVIDALRGGDWAEHQWESLKVLVVILAVIGVALSEYAFVSAHFPSAVAWANHVVGASS